MGCLFGANPGDNSCIMVLSGAFKDVEPQMRA